MKGARWRRGTGGGAGGGARGAAPAVEPHLRQHLPLEPHLLPQHAAAVAEGPYSACRW